MKYRLIGLDLDGTLLGRDGRPSAANLRAIARVQAAGALVVPCTGRTWRESRFALTDLPNPQVGVFVTGAAIADIGTGKTMDLAVIEPHLVRQLVEHLHDLPEAVLVCRDPELTGCDYLVTGRGALTGNTQWWFQHARATVQFVHAPTDEDLHHVVRVGAVALGPRINTICADIKRVLGDRVNLHVFAATAVDASTAIYVLEIFAVGVDKWRGLSWIAREHGIAPEQVAMIGDEINDVAALKAAGCGIAMGNANPLARDAADHVTLPCDEDGVAHALGKMLSGEW